jgi:hypothetical protein
MTHELCNAVLIIFILLGSFGKYSDAETIFNAKPNFWDFDAFASAVRDANCVMLLENLVHPRWSITHLELAGIHAQVRQEGSGNITEGRARADKVCNFASIPPSSD